MKKVIYKIMIRLWVWSMVLSHKIYRMAVLFDGKVKDD